MVIYKKITKTYNYCLRMLYLNLDTQKTVNLTNVYKMTTKNKKKFKITRSDILFALFLIILKCCFWDWYYIPSGSMIPTLQINDRVIVNMNAYSLRVPMTNFHLIDYSSPEAGDVVIFKEKNSGNIFIKRVIGTAGDIIKVSGHNVFVNGKQLKSKQVFHDKNITQYIERINGKEFIAQYIPKFDKLSDVQEYDLHNRPKEYIEQLSRFMVLRKGEWKVPSGKLFVMGDNRDESLDSRFPEVSLIDINSVRGKASFVLANMKPLTIGDTSIPFFPVGFSDFHKEIYKVAPKSSNA